MKNYLDSATEWVKVKTPSDIVAGEPVFIGDVFGIARLSAKAGELASLSRTGLFQADKVAGEAIALGAPVYWNAASKLYTGLSTGNAWVGAATVQALAADKKVTFVLQQSGGRTVNAITSLTGGIELSAGGVPVDVGSGVKAWRGLSQNMGVVVEGYSTTQWSCTTRTPHYSNARFRSVRCVLQTFAPTGDPIADTNFADDYNFQVGFELGYTQAFTGIQPRKLFTFGGSTIAQYLAANPPTSGYILSDVLELDRYVEADETFGLWTTVEHIGQLANKIPYRRNASNFLQKYIGRVLNTTSNIANDLTRLGTSVTPTTDSQNGASGFYTPTMLLIETDSTKPFVAVLGASHSVGVGEATEGSLNNGDGLGSARANSGFINRALFENLRFNAVNLGKGSDGNKNLRSPASWEKRRNLLVLSNPTHVINANIHNDITATELPITRQNSTAVAKWTVGVASGNHYICVKAGITGTVAPTGTAMSIIDGTVIWAYLQVAPGSSETRASSVSVANICNVSEQILDAVPNAKLIGMLPTFGASSTDQYVTVENQTPGFRMDPASARGLLVQMLRSNYPLLRHSAVLDPAQLYEYNYPEITSRWIVNGSPYWLTYDGTHFNSTGALRLSACVTADKFI